MHGLGLPLLRWVLSGFVHSELGNEGIERQLWWSVFFSPTGAMTTVKGTGQVGRDIAKFCSEEPSATGLVWMRIRTCLKTWTSLYIYCKPSTLTSSDHELPHQKKHEKIGKNGGWSVRGSVAINCDAQKHVSLWPIVKGALNVQEVYIYMVKYRVKPITKP